MPEELTHEFNDAGYHRLVYRNQEGLWTGYRFFAQLTVNGITWHCATEYWDGKFIAGKAWKVVYLESPTHEKG